MRCIVHRTVIVSNIKAGNLEIFTDLRLFGKIHFSLSFTDCRRGWRRSCFDMRPQITWYCLVVSVGPLEKTRYVSFLHPGLTAVLSLSYFSIHGSNYLVSFFQASKWIHLPPTIFFPPPPRSDPVIMTVQPILDHLPVLSDCDLSHCLWTDNRNVCVAVAGSAEAGRSHQVKDIIPDI